MTTRRAFSGTLPGGLAASLASLVTTSAALLALAPSAGAVVLTGDAEIDFPAVSPVVVVPDGNAAPDVGVPPQAPKGTISGWDLKDLRLAYDSSADALYVGLNTFGIGGDADGDGDEGGSSDWLLGNGGTDTPEVGGSEGFAVMFDLDQDGLFDVIAGVSAQVGLGQFTVATFAGTPYAPTLAFGAPLGAHAGEVTPAPGPGAPDLEFSISLFSQLPGFGGAVGPFSVQVFLGSFGDDGIGEEFLPNTPSKAIEVCFDADGDGVTTCGGDCDDSDAAAVPGGGSDLCDGADSDCDGETDEDFAPVPTACGKGVCAANGFAACVDGALVDSCRPGDPARPDDPCGSGDEDCDGDFDEDFESVPTTCGEGACAGAGKLVCDGGEVVDTCEPGTSQLVDSTCDGLDDDCDGAVDEGFAGKRTECGVGLCSSAGTLECQGGAVVDTCDPGQPGRYDPSCDGLDDDCDGKLDEDFPVEATTCGGGSCESEGELVCEGGAVVDTCEATLPDGLVSSWEADEHENPSGWFGTGHAFWLPGLYDMDPDHPAFLLLEDGARFDQHPDGTARLHGVATVYQVSDGPDMSGDQWEVDLRFTFRGEGPAGEGTSGPKNEFEVPEEVTDTWLYFDMTPGEATLTRLADPDLVLVLVQDPPGSAFPFQVGDTANQMNFQFGASAWFRYHPELDGAPLWPDDLAGDVNIDLVPVPCDEQPGDEDGGGSAGGGRRP